MTKMINTFGHGMDKDSSKNKYDNAHYYDANNIRIITQEGLTSGAIVDMMGTERRLDIGSGLNNGGHIIGYCVLREDLIIFIHEDVTLIDYIVRVPISELQAFTSIDDEVTIDYTNYHKDQVSPDDGYNLIYKAVMGFSIENPIKAIPRWETEFVKKVYWTDGNNNLRWINVVHDDDTNDLETLPVDRLEVIGNFDLTKPYITDIIGGNIDSGKIAYAYQLYMLHGSQTLFSPLSDMYHVTEAGDTEPDSKDYYGSHSDENTGKGFKVSFDIDSQYYTRCRVVAVHYTTLEDEPEIRIVEEFSISPTDTSATFTDIGESIGNLTVEELRILSTSVFVTEDIETKDNILFAGGITADSFDVDYDARAYRFAGISSTGSAQNYADAAVRGKAHLYEENGNYYEITGSTKVTTLEPAGTPIGDWDDIPEDADCINIFNDLDNKQDTARETTFRYQSDGITLGGEGPNVSFEFNIENIELCQDDVIDTPAASANYWYIREAIDSGNANNPSYKGYASPKYGGGNIVGYQRDEVYRFGVVFFDGKGRNSFVKWICDIAMPSISEHNITSYSVDRVLARVLNVEFEVNNLGGLTDVESYQIVRVKRSSTDRSILAQGLVNHPYLDGLTDIYHTLWATKTVPAIDTYQFHSPEVTFNKNLKFNGNTDYVQGVAQVSNVSGYKVVAGTATSLGLTRSSIYTIYNAVDEILANKYSTIFDGFIVKQDGVEYKISGYTYEIINNGTDSRKSICFLTLLDNITFIGRDKAANIRSLINYRRNIHESRYGGITYTARRRNEYIVASDIIPKANATSTVSGGDTYIGMFDCLYSVREIEDAASTVGPEVLYFPVETSINLPLIRPSGLSRTKTQPASYLIQEEAGIHEHTGGETYIQLEDYYAYNTVYSRENDARIFTSRPFDWKEIETFDVRVRASLTKINGEFTDSWLRFPANQYIEVDSQYGPLSALKVVNDRLLFFQTQAFGTLSVNERALIETQTVSQLSLGVADLLDRYDYGKTNIGCYHWRQLTLTPDALYWVDFLGKAAFKYSTGLQEVSLMKGMDSWFRENLINGDHDVAEGLHVFHDPDFKEVYIVDNDNDWGLIYNELTDSYVCFTDLQPTLAMNYLDKVLGASDGSYYSQRHNDEYARRGDLYDVNRELSVTLLVNPSGTDVGIFNNFEWLTEVFNNDVDQPVTWGNIKLWNDYQGIIAAGFNLVVGQNVKRRMRKWRYTIPRATYNRSGTVLNTNEKYARFRDSHLFAKFSYTNTEDTRRFVAHDIITSHTISNR